ncbi:hypothetical protein CN918_32265 [Priestia megaterium]|nr:hypothetical protein CN918_32265 [Priestia megaterium]
MKKRYLALGVLGAAAGVAIATKGKKEKKNEEVVANDEKKETKE